MVIFDPGLDEQAVQRHVDASIQLISSRGGEAMRVERWGKRRLAYEIQHHGEGYYVVFEANAEPSTMDELGRSLMLDDEVLRHKVVRLPDKVAGNRPPSTPPPADGESASTAFAAEAAGNNMSDNGITVNEE